MCSMFDYMEILDGILNALSYTLCLNVIIYLRLWTEQHGTSWSEINQRITI